MALSFKQWQKIFPRLTKLMQARWWVSFLSWGRTLSEAFQLYPSGHISKQGIWQNKAIPQAELGCKGPKSISLPHAVARPGLKWKSTVLYSLAPSLPREVDNQVGQVRPHKNSHFVIFFPRGWQGHIPWPRGEQRTQFNKLTTHSRGTNFISQYLQLYLILANT